MLDVLCHRHRRRLIVALCERDAAGDSPLDLASLGETVAPNGDERQVHAEMVHRHLPKLDRAGYVRWDRDAGTIARGPEWAAIEPLLNCLLDRRTELPDDLV